MSEHFSAVSRDVHGASGAAASLTLHEQPFVVLGLDLDLLDAVSAAALVLCPTTATILFANRAAGAMIGRNARDARGSHIRRIFPDTWREVLAAARRPAPGPPARIECVHHRSDGSEIVLQTTVTTLHLEQGPVAICESRDVTMERRTAERLSESELRNELITAVSSDGLWDWDLTTNSVTFSAQWKRLLGYEPLEIGVSPDEWFNRVHPDDVDRVHFEISRFLEGTGGAPLQTRHRLLHKNGSYRWVLLRAILVRLANGELAKLFGAHTDVTERRNAEEQLERKAFYDPLTDLPNRALFMDRLNYAVRRAKRGPGPLFAVLFVDLDRFKIVNDSLGPVAGDELLVGIARRLESCVRHTDTLARIGGDEFAVLLDRIVEPGDAGLVADRIHDELLRPFEISGHTVFSSASVGVALSNVAHESAEDLVREADIAMYRAKAAGKARYEVYDSAMHTRVMKQLEVESELRTAVDRGEFCVYYQPIVALRTGRLSGFEALVRWNHPTRGIVLPDEFIPAAEETGLIVTIDGIVLSEVCRQLREWQDEYPQCSDLTASVNLSGRNFSQPGLVAAADRALAEARLDPTRLKVEITETALMVNPDSAAEILAELKSRGIQLLLDDFGTGYSSLSHLGRFPIDTIKIDRTFVRQLSAPSRREGAIVRSVVMLGRSLGLEVVAEGVETYDDLAKLRALGCDYGQGYFLSRPLAADSVPGYVVAERRYGGYVGWSGNSALRGVSPSVAGEAGAGEPAAHGIAPRDA